MSEKSVVIRDIEQPGEENAEQKGWSKRSKMLFAGLGLAAVAGAVATATVITGNVAVQQPLDVSAPSMGASELEEFKAALLSVNSTIPEVQLIGAVKILAAKEEARLEEEYNNEILERGWSNRLKCFRTKKYSLTTINAADVDTELTVPTTANNYNNCPDGLRGMFYMENNPLADEVASFGNGVMLSPTVMRIEVAGARMWTWHDSDEGTRLWSGAQTLNMYYQITTNENYTFAVIEPVIFGLKVPQNENIVSFTMRKIDENNWLRESTTIANSGEVHEYQFRQIVDDDGNKIQPVYDRYVRENKGGATAQIGIINPVWKELECEQYEY